MCEYPPSEVFVSDQTSNLFAIDMRNGRVIYGYKGISLFCTILDCWDALADDLLNARHRGSYHLRGSEPIRAHLNFT
jgi:hypothetical protein